MRDRVIILFFQLRLDFTNFMISGPSTFSIGNVKTVSGGLVQTFIAFNKIFSLMSFCMFRFRVRELEPLLLTPPNA